MKAAVLCAVFSVLALAFSQPTYEPEKQELCDGICQEHDLKTLQKQFTAQFTAINKKISQLMQLKKQVDRVLPMYSGSSRDGVNDTELPGGGYPTSPNCPVNFTYVPSVRGCYHVVLDKLDWYHANKRCISLHPDSHLVIINSQAEQSFLGDFLFKKRNIVVAFSAGRRVNTTIISSSFVWKLITANYYAQLPISYDGWSPGEPDSVKFFCLALHQHTNYLWQDMACEYAFNSVCEIDIA